MNISQGITIYASIAFILFVIFYLMYLYMAIREGYKRDFNILFLIFFSLIATPFATYAYVKSAKKDSDRIKVTTKSKLVTKITTLTHIIDNQIPLSEITDIENIGLKCRFCDTSLNEDDIRCTNCNKPHLTYRLVIVHPPAINLKIISIPLWRNEKPESVISEVIRVRNKG